MNLSPKAQAGKQLIFALCLLAVAIVGYLTTRTYMSQVPPPSEVATTTVGVTSSLPAVTPATSTKPGTESGQVGRQTFEGTYECLPHRDTKGPQTLECALGLKANSGEHYALSTTVANAESASATTPTGARVRITGSLNPEISPGSDEWKQYDIAGVIKVATFTRL